MPLRSALVSEAEALSQIAIAAKAHWGYSDEFMQSCRHELVVSEEALCRDKEFVVVSETQGQITGFYVLVDEGAEDGERLWDLDAMFVDPASMGNGVGRALFEHAVDAVSLGGGGRMKIQSDPYAEGFYLAMGAARIGEKMSGSISGRMLPLLAVDIAPSQPLQR